MVIALFALAACDENTGASSINEEQVTAVVKEQVSVADEQVVAEGTQSKESSAWDKTKEVSGDTWDAT